MCVQYLTYILYACDVCGIGFTTTCTRRTHMVTHTEDRPFKCAKCQKGFKSSMRLRNHMVSHSDEREYKTECELCDCSHVTYHMRNHSDAHAFQCTVCERSFKSKLGLRGHIFSHTGERAFSCAHCKTGFRRKSCLNKHRCKDIETRDMEST